MSKFVMKQDVATTDFDWGSAGMRVDVPSTGCETLRRDGRHAHARATATTSTSTPTRTR